MRHKAKGPVRACAGSSCREWSMSGRFQGRGCRSCPRCLLVKMMKRWRRRWSSRSSPSAEVMELVLRWQQRHTNSKATNTRIICRWCFSWNPPGWWCRVDERWCRIDRWCRKRWWCSEVKSGWNLQCDDRCEERHGVQHELCPPAWKTAAARHRTVSIRNSAPIWAGFLSLVTWSLLKSQWAEVLSLYDRSYRVSHCFHHQQRWFLLLAKSFGPPKS